MKSTVSVPKETTIGYLPQQMKLADTQTVREEAEHALKEEQLKHEKRDAIIKNILTGVQVVACGIMIPIWGVKAAAKYEEEGVFKNVWTRAAITDILPKRKK